MKIIFMRGDEVMRRVEFVLAAVLLTGLAPIAGAQSAEPGEANQERIDKLEQSVGVLAEELDSLR